MPLAVISPCERTAPAISSVPVLLSFTPCCSVTLFSTRFPALAMPELKVMVPLVPPSFTCALFSAFTSTETPLVSVLLHHQYPPLTCTFATSLIVPVKSALPLKADAPSVPLSARFTVPTLPVLFTLPAPVRVPMVYVRSPSAFPSKSRETPVANATLLATLPLLLSKSSCRTPAATLTAPS